MLSSEQSDALSFKLRRRRALREGALALIIILIVIVARYWKVLFLGYSLVPGDVVLWTPPWADLRPPTLQPPWVHADVGDQVSQVFPWRFLAAQQIQAHVLPIWNQLYLSGSPLLANAQSAVLYPLNLLYYALPTVMAFSYAVLLRFGLAAVFTFVFMRRLGVRWTGSVVGAISFAFCGYLTYFQGWTHSDTAIWLPASMLAVLLLSRAITPSRILLLAAVTALQVLAGHPETAVVILVCDTVYALFLAITEVRGRPGQVHLRQFSAAFVGALVLGFGLTAVQILPTMEWLAQTTRVSEPVLMRLPIRYIATFLVADMSPIRLPAEPVSTAIPAGVSYAGALTLLAAAVSVPWLRRDPRVLFFFLLSVVFLLVTLAVGPIYDLFLLMPLGSTFRSYYFVLLVLLGISVLAGLTIDHLERERWPGPLFTWYLGGTALILAGATTVVSALAQAPATWFALATRWTIILPVVVLGLSVVVLRLSSAVRAGGPAWKLGRIVLVLAVAADSALLSAHHVQAMPSNLIYPLPPTYRFLMDQSGPFRTVSVDNASHDNFGMVFGISSAAGYDFPLRRYADVLDRLGSSGVITSEKIVGPNRRLLDLLNVRYVIATTENGSDRPLANDQGFRLAFEDGSMRIFENRGWLPRALMVPTAEVMTSEPAIVQRLLSSDFDPTSTVLVEEAARSSGTVSGTSSRPKGIASVLSSEPTTVRVGVDSSEGGLLLLTDIYYPGWQAYVDGRPAKVLRADYIFRAVALDEGSHEVVFRYEPRSILIGDMISLAALIVTVGLACVGVRRRMLERG